MGYRNGWLRWRPRGCWSAHRRYGCSCGNRAVWRCVLGGRRRATHDHSIGQSQLRITHAIRQFRCAIRRAVSEFTGQSSQERGFLRSLLERCLKISDGMGKKWTAFHALMLPCALDNVNVSVSVFARDKSSPSTGLTTLLFCERRNPPKLHGVGFV